MIYCFLRPREKSFSKIDCIVDTLSISCISSKKLKKVIVMILDVLVEVLEKSDYHQFQQVAFKIKDCPIYQEISFTSSTGGFSVGASIGIVVACLALVLVFAITGVLLYKKNWQFAYTKN